MLPLSDFLKVFKFDCELYLQFLLVRLTKYFFLNFISHILLPSQVFGNLQTTLYYDRIWYCHYPIDLLLTFSRPCMEGTPNPRSLLSLYRSPSPSTGSKGLLFNSDLYMEVPTSRKSKVSVPLIYYNFYVIFPFTTLGSWLGTSHRNPEDAGIPPQIELLLANGVPVHY